MGSVVYYPGFEVQNEDLLKLALLYMDNLKPIVPYSADIYLSSTHEKLKFEAGLIQEYRPEYGEGVSATRDAIEAIEKIARFPDLFGDFLGGPDFLMRWRNDLDNKDRVYTLWREKYSQEWQDYCVRNRFGRQTIHGLAISGDLGKLYMAILAQTISDYRGMSIITDHEKINDLLFTYLETREHRRNHRLH